MSLLQGPFSVLLAVKYSQTRKHEMAVDNLKNCSLVQSIIQYTLKEFNANNIQFLIPSDRSRSIDLYVKFKINNENVLEDIVEKIKNDTHGNLETVSGFIQD